AYKLIDQFNWEVEDMEGIMHEAHETDAEIEDVAKDWVKDHPEKVKEWTKGVNDVTNDAMTVSPAFKSAEEPSWATVETCLPSICNTARSVNSSVPKTLAFTRSSSSRTTSTSCASSTTCWFVTTKAFPSSFL